MDLLKNIIQECPTEGVLMGLDIGTKTIGVAVSDSAQSIAFPISTINRKKFSKDLIILEDLMREYDAVGVVLGFPLNMDNSEGPKCQSVRDFGLELLNQLSPELKSQMDYLALWDERFSTVSVEEFVDKTVDISKRRAKDKGIIDKLAAQHILQGALDYLNQNR